jgi:hypothetical protein
MTVPFVAADNTSQTADSTTGGFKVGHYLNEDLLLYVASESGYRRPSITITSTAMNPALLPFAEEESDMLEMGLKGTLWTED